MSAARFVRVWSNDPDDPQSRFRVEWPWPPGASVDDDGDLVVHDDEIAILADENVVGGDPTDPDAVGIESRVAMWLAPADVRRLRDALTELLAILGE
jgi:hypothetical protein